MELILWRHAEAEEGYPDSGRRLTAKGEKQAKRMGGWLDKHLPADARILASPAVRARQTAEGIGRRFETAAEIDVGANPASHLDAAGWPDADGIVVLVGHQPTLGRVAAYLMTGEAADWGIKKGALWWFASRDGGASGVVLKAVLPPDLAD